jgi:hypothetical protein
MMMAAYEAVQSLSIKEEKIALVTTVDYVSVMEIEGRRIKAFIGQ